MIDSEQIRERILGALPGAAVEVRDMTGTADHYEVRVVAKAFEGCSAVERHRMVYSADGKVLYDNVWYSRYDGEKRVIHIGTKQPAKPKGPTGATGAVGPSGPTGPTGPTG